MSLPVALNPLEHPQWDEKIVGHPKGSFFLGSAWARVLQDTYGHQPHYFCDFRDGQIDRLLPLMEVRCRLTGRRGVSLPFTDYCSPISPTDNSAKELFAGALQLGRNNGWKYLETRGKIEDWPGSSTSVEFYSHIIGLNSSKDALYQSMESSVRRGIRKAEQAGLNVQFSNADEAMRQFFQLHCMTRRRHGVPPQPWLFFENISRYVMQAGKGLIGLTLRQGKPVAAAVFFHSGREAVYKFGASDYCFQHERPNNLLMWEAVKYYAAKGFGELHLGRTSIYNEGLRRFKRGLGGRENKLSYARYDFQREQFVQTADRATSGLNRLFRHFPLPLLRAAGALLYPQLS